jgi:hypothetical protein
MDRLNHWRFLRLARNQRRAGVTAGFEVAGMINPQAAFLFLFAVAFETAVGENRANFAFEESMGSPLGVGFVGGNRGG